MRFKLRLGELETRNHPRPKAKGRGVLYGGPSPGLPQSPSLGFPITGTLPGIRTLPRTQSYPTGKSGRASRGR